MQYTVYLAKNTKQKTNFELFPDPARLIKNWTDEMAQRLLPIAMFDLELAGEISHPPAFFLYYDDYSISYLNWRFHKGQIELKETWKNIQPFHIPPDVDAIKQTSGAYLEYFSYDIEIGLPSEFDYDNRWDYHWEEQMLDAGAKSPMSKIRVGGGFPCYVQGIVDYDDPGFVAECPTGSYGLPPIYLYLFSDGNGGFSQEMQLT